MNLSTLAPITKFLTCCWASLSDIPFHTSWPRARHSGQRDIGPILAVIVIFVVAAARLSDNKGCHVKITSMMRFCASIGVNFLKFEKHIGQSCLMDIVVLNG